MSEGWDGNPIKEAIAEQEEYIKRSRSCMDQLGRAHAFRPHGRPAEDERPRAFYSACTACGVTETAEDYRRKMGITE